MSKSPSITLMVFRGLLMKTELKEKDDLEDSGVIGEPVVSSKAALSPA